MQKLSKSLDKEVLKNGNWVVVWTIGAMFEVTQGFTMKKFMIDLDSHTYSCYFWDLVRIPCRHVIVASNYRLEQLMDKKCDQKYIYLKLYL